MTVKVVNALLALMFFAFAAVQYNDPDPGLWIIIYGAMGVACAAAMFDYYSSPLMIGMVGGYLVLSALHVEGMLAWLNSQHRKEIFDDVAKMQYPYIEEAREFLGLLICLIVLQYLFYRERRTKALKQAKG
jgi:hypothetical protein